MLNPIKLTEYGETISPYPGNEDKGDVVLSNCIGKHVACNCWVDLLEVSMSHNAIVCRCCGLRVVIPKVIRRWKHLELYAKEQLK